MNRVCAADRSESEPLQDTTVPLLPPTWLPCPVGGCATPQGRGRDHVVDHAHPHLPPHFQCMRRWEHPRPPSSSSSSSSFFSFIPLFLHKIDKTNATHTEMTDAPQPAQPATETSAPAPSPAPASAAVTPPQHRSTVKPLALDAREPQNPNPHTFSVAVVDLHVSLLFLSLSVMTTIHHTRFQCLAVRM